MRTSAGQVKSSKRSDGRAPGQLRNIALTRGVMKFADASCLVEWGHTKLICTATVEEKVPSFLRNSGTDWITAEYGMLPRSSQQRIEREAARGRVTGRTQEIQRLIGRSLRGVVDLSKLGERTIILDCDVIQADGGTRCAAITGSFVALAEALRQLRKTQAISIVPIRDAVAAVSVGIVKGQPVLDLNYAEDSTADVDMNIVMTGRGGFVELQGTAERHPFTMNELTRLLTLARAGIRHLFLLQQHALGISALKSLVTR